MIKSINPATNKTIGRYEEFQNDKVDFILEEVAKEYELWKTISFKERSHILLNIASSLINEIDKHSRMITEEIGKPITESKQEIEKCAWVLKYFALNSESFLESEEIKTDYKKSYVQYDPLGVILGVMPWNFPYWQVIRFIAPVLMAGNTCVIKHASNVSGCSLLIEKLIQENSPYLNIFRSLIIKSDKVESVIKNKHVKAVSLTGSDEAGSDVAMQAGREIKKTVLELGGSDPFIVLDDADVEKAAKTAVLARFFNTGQSCIAAKRFLVHEDVYDEFIHKIKEHMNNLTIGDPMLDDTKIGPLAKQEFVDDLNKIVKQSIEDGAKCILGGESHGCFFTPALLVDVTEDMSVFKEETFGPVLCIAKIKNADEAVKIANKSEYGLGGSLWTANINLAKKLTKQINTGAVFINDMTKSDPRLPFGGINKSGYGIELSKYGIKEFVNTKTIVIN